MTEDQVWQMAVEAASYSNCEKRHVGCIILDDDGVFVAHGYNWHENEICDCWDGDGTAVHAEMMAVNNISIFDREKKLHAFITHKPCDKCLSVLKTVCASVTVKELSERFKDPRDAQARPDNYEANMDAVDAILQERESTHGDFNESSRFVQSIKTLMESTPNWEDLRDNQKESLHMVVHKIGRILYGNPCTKDHWDDCAGYSKLGGVCDEE